MAESKQEPQSPLTGQAPESTLQSPSCCFLEKKEVGGGDIVHITLGRLISDGPVEDRMSPHAIDNDRCCRAQQQGGHDDNGGQDDEDNDPDIQDVLGERGFHRDLADGIHASSLCDRQGRGSHSLSYTLSGSPKLGSLTTCALKVT